MPISVMNFTVEEFSGRWPSERYRSGWAWASMMRSPLRSALSSAARLAVGQCQGIPNPERQGGDAESLQELAAIQRDPPLRFLGEQKLDLLEDLLSVGGRGHGKPGLLGVDHHVGPFPAEAHAAPARYADPTLPTPLFDLLFEVIFQGRVAAAVGAGFFLPAAVVGADKHVAGVWACLFLHAVVRSLLTS